MPFKSGQSGNPKGRPVGSKNKRTLLAQQLEDAGSAVQAVVIKKALEEEDMQAAALVMSRVNPPLRPAAQRVQFELDTSLPIADQSRQIVQAVANGELDVDTGKQLLDMLSAYIGMKDVETFLSELKKLREAKTGVAGGVLES